MSAIRMYRAMACRTRVRIWLSIAAVAYSTVGAVAQVSAVDRSPASSPWESPTVIFAAVGLVISCAGVLIGVGAFVQTVKQQNDAIAEERQAREAFEALASAQFARKDVLAEQLNAIRGELAAVLRAVRAEGS